MGCLFSKNLEDFINLLLDLLGSTDKISQYELDTILSCFPFNIRKNEKFINPNYLIVKLIRKFNLNPVTVSQKLNISLKSAEEILKNPIFEVKFPIVNSQLGILNTALIIPLKEKIVVFPDKEILPKEIEEGIKRVFNITLQGFFITFKYVPFIGQSFTMSIYAALKFGEIVSNFAFTGILTKDGNFERVEFLEKKLEVSYKERFPLVFADTEFIENIKDLEEFLTDLKIPFSILLKEDRVKEFESSFKFKESFLRKVFNLKKRLHYITEEGILPEKKTSFNALETWIDSTINEIKQKIFSKIKDAKIVTAQYLLAPAFICGLKISKAGIPIVFYNYNKSKRDYEAIYTILNDKFDKLIEPTKYFEIYKPKEIEEIYISAKSQLSLKENTFLIKAKYKNLPEDERIKGIAQGLASLLRDLPKNKNYKLRMEVPTALTFALGYYLEDYLNISVYHKNLVAFKIGNRGNIYLTNAFSIGMLPLEELQVNFKPLSLEEAKEILKSKNIISYISHESTAQVLSEMLKTKISLNRSNLKAKKGDTLIIFQIYQRPKEGQVFSLEELKEILQKQKFNFWKVEILA